MTYYNKTKIVATISYQRSNTETITNFIKAGVNVFRINSSHSDPEEIEKIIVAIKNTREKLNTQVAILQDLQGPKIRIGPVENDEIYLENNSTIKISQGNKTGNHTHIFTNYKNLINDIAIGEDILIDDGKLLLKVIDKDIDYVSANVINGGTLRSRKGMNLPKTQLSGSSLTPKDHQDLEVALRHNVEWIALSFVRNSTEVKELKSIIHDNNKDCRVISKIEKPEAIKDIDNIITESDGVMVARGDLGVEIPMEKVPVYQKMIVSKCNQIGRPVIIATQMLESMIHSPTPTRAEVNDVANAVMDNADALMLSAETAIGKYPIEAVSIMKDTITSIEKHMDIYNIDLKPTRRSLSFHSDQIVQTTCSLANTINARAIIGSTASGYTALEIAKHRPKSSIYIFTDNKFLINTFSLIWGVRSFCFERQPSVDNIFMETEKILFDIKLIKKGDVCIHTGAIPFDKNERSNMLRVSVIDIDED